MGVLDFVFFVSWGFLLAVVLYLRGINQKLREQTLLNQKIFQQLGGRVVHGKFGFKEFQTSDEQKRPQQIFREPVR